MKGYDEWLEKQADEYYREVIEHDEDDGNCQCDDCLNDAHRDYEEAKADAIIEAEREKRHEKRF